MWDHGKEIFEDLRIKKISLHIKTLIIPHFFNFCLVSPINGGGGGAGPLYPLIATPVTVV